MQATRTGHSWIIQTETNKEEVALLSFLSAHKQELSGTSAPPRDPEPNRFEPSHLRLPHSTSLDLPHDL